MKKVVLGLALIAGLFSANAQDDKKEEPKEGWNKSGNITFLFNQASFSNWVAGGQNNFSGTLGLNYDFNYLKGDWSWDNKIIAAYGLTKIEDNEFTRKTDDRLELNSLLGKKAGGNWYYSAFLNFRTQFAKGYEFGTDPVTGEETRTEQTSFFSPAYLQFGPGLLWKKSDNLKVNIAPATARFIFVDPDFTLPDAAYFGVDEGDSSRFEFGASLSAYYKFNLMENVSFENILNLYTNYLEDPQNVDLDYQLNIIMKINKYLSTNLAFQTIYDDNAIGRLQVRQVFGLGVNYGF
ncbi:DUF3078 domain-containing protein [Leptobacterium flavescens]|uniref:DUF3078 domain-containing protein n=1 Tax=Leptobacterium flavescens TaxID=472055 RepID=A0A6P0UJI9_9FLAO|nr:DUF3078 domain-containing protein [Leptobacterium flavescens]NER13147.1 DUF3078 domain-containing protein [Leptobacterium flavescens]